IVRGWHGSKVLFSTTRASFSGRFHRLFEVDASTGIETMLPIPEGHQGSISPDGKFMAYIKLPDPADKDGSYRPFKLYRGGNMPKVWIFNLATYEIEEVPAENSNNTQPVWVGDDIFFLSDRDKKNNNIFRYSRSSKKVEKLTSFTDFPVASIYSNGTDLSFEQGGKIYLMDNTGKQSQVKIRLDVDIPTRRPHYQNVASNIRAAHISPTGQRVVVEARGEIMTVPAEKGDIRNITNTPAAHERNPAWSPDGKYIAYFSDESGEYQLKLRDQKGTETVITIPLGEPNFYYNPVWSPDSKKILYSDKHLRLYYIDISAKKPVLIDQETFDRPDYSFDANWSPDSKWITYHKREKNNLRNIYIYEVANAKKHTVTDGLSETANPVFSRDGKYIFFTASTNFARNVGWLDMSSYDNRAVSNIYAVVLSKKTPSILAPQSDDETVAPPGETAKADSTKKTPATKGSKKATGAKEDKKDDEKTPAVIIDFDGIGDRIEVLPVKADNIYMLNGKAEGKLYYLTVDPAAFEPMLHAYNIADRKSEDVVTNVDDYSISADGKKLFYNADGSMSIVSLAGKVNPSEGKLNVADMKVLVDPEKEWKQMFDELWRIERDFFYVENLHGADWNGIRKKYETFLPYVGHRDDLNYLFNIMMAELVIGHNYVGAGEYPKGINVNVGLLGADYEVKDGFYQIKKIYTGLSWNPDITAPLMKPGVDIKEGEYVVAVTEHLLIQKRISIACFRTLPVSRLY
ncbi:MAG: PDZ domain-containing protein, partial [Flavitalea sp.]